MPYLTRVDDAQTFAIVGAAIEVHSVMGGGLFERVYQRALEIELAARGLPYQRESPIALEYRGVQVGIYRPDFVCYGNVIVEIKAITDFTGAHYAQPLHYLMAVTGSRALLINFGRERLQWKRFVRSPRSTST